MLSVFCKKSNDKGSEDGQLSYRQQVITALVQRYIESARREFEETKRKGNDSFSKHLISFVERIYPIWKKYWATPFNLKFRCFQFHYHRCIESSILACSLPLQTKEEIMDHSKEVIVPMIC